MKWWLMALVVLLLVACGPPQDVPAAEILDNPQEGIEDKPILPLPGASAAEQYTEVPINSEKSTFKFEGYAPGKSHIGTFTEISGVVYIGGKAQNGNIVGGKGEIQAASVETNIEKLNTHLKSDDFFDVEKNPTINFVSTSLIEGIMTGELTFVGVTHTASFPVKVTENSISADFRLDTTPFGMKYIAVDKEVRIMFEFVI